MAKEKELRLIQQKKQQENNKILEQIRMEKLKKEAEVEAKKELE